MVAGVEVGFNHDADDAVVAGGELLGDGGGDFGLVVVVFQGVPWEGFSIELKFERRTSGRREARTYRASSQSS